MNPTEAFEYKEFEFTVLKMLLTSSEYFGKSVPILKSTFFKNLGNQKLFELIKQHYLDYNVVPQIHEVAQSIKNVPNVELRSSIVQSIQELQKVPVIENSDFLIQETVTFAKDALFLEALMIGSDGISQKSEEKKLLSKRLMEEMSKLQIDTDLGISYDDVELMITYFQEKLMGIRTQHKEFNKRLGAGFLPKTLSVIMAASGIGKSLLMTDLISGMIQEGKNVLLVSMEMQDREIMKRVYANVLDLDINSLRTVSPDIIRTRHAEKKAKGQMGVFKVKDYPNGTFSALMLDELLDSYETQENLKFDVIMLDYLGIMKSDLVSASAGLYSYVKSIAEEVRSIAVKRSVRIISASQLNRSAVNNTDASNDSVSDSIGTVQTADFIVFLLQDESMKERNVITCKVTKNRFNGRTDKWDMNVDYEHMRFTDAIEGSGMDEEYVRSEIENTFKQDLDIISKHDADFGTQKSTESKEYDIMKELGL